MPERHREAVKIEALQRVADALENIAEDGDTE